MAKTTRKTETATGEKQPATRRKTAAAGTDGAVKASSRRRAKAASDAAPEAAGSVTTAQAVRAAAVPEPTHEEIALRAWNIYQLRGATHGQAMSDWLEAKRQLLAERGLAE